MKVVITKELDNKIYGIDQLIADMEGFDQNVVDKAIIELLMEDVVKLLDGAKWQIVPTPIPCDAIIWHGPGHMSSTRCELTDKHNIHYASYGRYGQDAYWTGKETYSGFSDEPPKLPEGMEEE